MIVALPGLFSYFFFFIVRGDLFCLVLFFSCVFHSFFEGNYFLSKIGFSDCKENKHYTFIKYGHYSEIKIYP